MSSIQVTEFVDESIFDDVAPFQNKIYTSQQKKQCELASQPP